MSKTFRVEIVTPKGKLFSEEVISLSSRSIGGSFTILANHANFLTQLIPGTVSIKKANGEYHEFFISESYIEVVKERTIIVADKALDGNNLSFEELKSAEELYKAKVTRKKEEKEFVKQENMLKEHITQMKKKG